MSKNPKPSDPDPSESIPKLSKTQQESTEQDLWDLDDDIEVPEDPNSSSPPLPAKKTSKSLIQSTKPSERKAGIPPAPDQKTTSPKTGNKPAGKKKTAAKKTGARKAAAKKSPSKKAAAPSRPVKKTPKAHDLDELDSLDDLDETKTSDANEPTAKKEFKSKLSTTALAKEEKLAAEEKETAPKEQAPEKKPDSEEIEAGAEEKESTPFSFSTYSKTEKLSVCILAAVLLLGGILSVIYFSNKVPTKPIIAEAIDFPVEGKRISITDAVSYWREPNIANGDIVKRDTKLIPVLDISLTAKKPTALRIFFRNDTGDVVGDGVTREVTGETKFSVPATAGFDDIGMHAAYRTGGSPPWFIQVYEGPDINASREQFSKVLEMEISTDRR